MAKTTQEDRDYASLHGMPPSWERQFIEDAKRLAQIERQVRELADLWDSAADEADEDPFASGEAVERCRRHARKLRAIIDPPEDT